MASLNKSEQLIVKIVSKRVLSDTALLFYLS